MRPRDAASKTSTAAPVRGSCPTCGTSRRGGATAGGAALVAALLVTAACTLAGCDPACTVAFENHTDAVVRVRPPGARAWQWDLAPCQVRLPLQTAGSSCSLDWEAVDDQGQPVALEVVVSENMPGFPFYLFRAGVGSGECDDPPQVAVYVTVRNRTGVLVTLQVDGTDAGRIPPDTERRLGPVPGNLAHKFYPKVTATDPDGQPLRVERVAVEQGGTAVPMMTVEVLPTESAAGG